MVLERASRGRFPAIAPSLSPCSTNVEIIARRPTLRRVEALLTTLDGKPLNTALAGRLLGVSRTTAAALVRSLQQRGTVRLLPYLDGRRKPLFYLRGSREEPVSFHSFCTDAIIHALPGLGYSWWMTGRVRQVDLVMEVGARRIGFCFTPDSIVRNRYWYPLNIAFQRGVVHACFLLYKGDHASLRAGCIQVLPLGAFLKEPETWLFERQAPREARDARNRINELAYRAFRRRAC
jgi:hypothetical protein